MTSTLQSTSAAAGSASSLAFLFPVHALQAVFKAKFIEALRAAENGHELARDPSNTPSAGQLRLNAPNRHDWVVYAKTPLAGPEAVLDCLSRYTHRVAVSNERILSMAAAGVRLRVRADNQGGKGVITLDGPEFIARFLQHGLPSGFKRIPPLRPAQPSAQNRAHGHRASRAAQKKGSGLQKKGSGLDMQRLL